MAVQLGGNDPELLGRAAYHCEAFGGYDEINLNCGCPSPKVSERCFGARLMLDPERVRCIVASMCRQATHTEVTVKCRIGADDRDSYDDLLEFVHACRAGGVRHLVVHARKCLLSGLSAAQNRSVPPLHYEGKVALDGCAVKTLEGDFFCCKLFAHHCLFFCWQLFIACARISQK